MLLVHWTHWADGQDCRAADCLTSIFARDDGCSISQGSQSSPNIHVETPFRPQERRYHALDEAPAIDVAHDAAFIPHTEQAESLRGNGIFSFGQALPPPWCSVTIAHRANPPWSVSRALSPCRSANRLELGRRSGIGGVRSVRLRPRCEISEVSQEAHPE